MVVIRLAPRYVMESGEECEIVPLPDPASTAHHRGSPGVGSYACNWFQISILSGLVKAKIP